MTLFVIAPQPRILQVEISNPEEIVCLWKRKKGKRWQQAAHTFLCVIRFPRRPFQIKKKETVTIFIPPKTVKKTRQTSQRERCGRKISSVQTRLFTTARPETVLSFRKQSRGVVRASASCRKNSTLRQRSRCGRRRRRKYTLRR